MLFANPDSLLVFLIALLTIGPMLWELAPRLLPERARRNWLKLGKAGRAAAIFAVILVSGIAVSKEPLRKLRIGQQTLPTWFVELGYDTSDTDDDGIPDCWERWTRTNPAVDDSSFDTDGDGIDNLAEFQNQCDPLLADTDGDGFDDATEVLGLMQSLPDFNPIVPASYPAKELDANGNGTPDAWEYASTNLFAGLSTSGFPTGYAFPSAHWRNYDVLLTISSSRYSMLSWPSEDRTVQCLLPPCTNLNIRLRLDSQETQTVRLSAVPTGATGDMLGIWKTSMSATWDTRRSQSTEGNRVAAENGTMVDCVEEGMRKSFSGVFGTGSGVLNLTFVPKWMTYSWDLSSGCWEHGPSPTIEICETNLPPPYLWSDGYHQSESWSHFFSVPLGWLGDWRTYLYCRPVDEAHTNLVPEIEVLIDFGHCTPGSTNFVAAMAGSTHNPQDGSDHEPGIGITQLEQPGINCPEAFALVVTSGWTHVESILHIRNLVRIPTGNLWDDETDHCIGLVWSEGGSINLYDYLADCCKPFAESYDYYVNGVESDGTLMFGPEPEEFHPSVFHVELRIAESEIVLDRMWIVVNAVAASKNFDKWHSVNSTNTSWTATLPKPYAHISTSTNLLGIVSSIDPEPSEPNQWGKPESLTAWFRPRYLHHDAQWEMRSKADANLHGNQACYDTNGSIIRNGLAAGTADFVAGDLSHARSHVREDVDPYLHALHLDGNPGDTQNDNGLSKPCLYQGSYFDKYHECRPTILPEGGE